MRSPLGVVASKFFSRVESIFRVELFARIREKHTINCMSDNNVLFVQYMGNYSLEIDSSNTGDCMVSVYAPFVTNYRPFLSVNPIFYGNGLVKILGGINPHNYTVFELKPYNENMTTDMVLGSYEYSDYIVVTNNLYNFVLPASSHFNVSTYWVYYNWRDYNQTAIRYFENEIEGIIECAATSVFCQDCYASFNVSIVYAYFFYDDNDKIDLIFDDEVVTYQNRSIINQSLTRNMVRNFTVQCNSNPSEDMQDWAFEGCVLIRFSAIKVKTITTTSSSTITQPTTSTTIASTAITEITPTTIESTATIKTVTITKSSSSASNKSLKFPVVSAIIYAIIYTVFSLK